MLYYTHRSIHPLNTSAQYICSIHLHNPSLITINNPFNNTLSNPPHLNTVRSLLLPQAFMLTIDTAWDGRFCSLRGFGQETLCTADIIGYQGEWNIVGMNEDILLVNGEGEGVSCLCRIPPQHILSHTLPTHTINTLPDIDTPINSLIRSLAAW